MEDKNLSNLSTVDKIRIGLKLAYRKLIEEKIKNNQKLVVWKNGKIVYLDPKEKLDKINSEEKNINLTGQ